MGIEIVFILLPIAAASGWWMGWRSAARKKTVPTAPLSADYFKGLNYLLNEQPDRAIDIFTRMIEIDSDTIEVHYALASLFLRRGEVDRAIRIHQNLIARPTLTRKQQNDTLYLLGNDYLRAGVLDRAEGIFSDLVHTQEHGHAALRNLLDIYQQEKDWEQAIAIAKRLKKYGGDDLDVRVAHYYCELAIQAWEQDDYAKVSKMLKQALASDKQCARASSLEGDVAKELGKPGAAIRAYQRVVKQDPALIPDVLDKLVACYREEDKLKHALSYIQEIHAQHPGMANVLALTRLGRELNAEEMGLDILRDYLQREPSVKGVLELLSMLCQQDRVEKNDLGFVYETLKKLGENHTRYCCHHCGFKSQSLYWQCPSCKTWDSIRAICGASGCGEV